MPGTLNSFQKTMLQWNDLHPYNAVHVIRIPDALDLPRLRGVIGGTLEGYGLGELRLDRAQGTYRYDGGPSPVEITIVPAGPDLRIPLSVEIERQLNTDFRRDEPFSPFRFFVATEEMAFYLGLAYFHPIGDAECIVWLLKRLADAYQRRPEATSLGDMDLYAAGRSGLLRRPVLLTRKLASLPGFIGRLRRSCRPPYRDIHDLQNRFTMCTMTPEHLRSLIAAGKAWGVTLNDLFLALLVKCLGTLAAPRAHGKRTSLSVGCIVNTRRDLERDGRTSLGVFLGSFVVTHEISQITSLRELAVNIRGQTVQMMLLPLLRESFTVGLPHLRGGS